MSSKLRVVKRISRLEGNGPSQWKLRSESMEAALCSSELGKWSSQSNAQKTRSSLTKVGELLDEELDQVNL
jgi:hypothetical protein